MERREPLVRLGDALTVSDRLQRIEDRLDALARAVAVQTVVYGVLLVLILLALAQRGAL